MRTEYPRLESIRQADTVVDVRKMSALELVELQSILFDMQYYKGAIDGLVGARTIEALSKFKSDNYLEHSVLVGGSTIARLIEKRSQWLQVLPVFSSTDKLVTQKAIMTECIRQGLAMPLQQAYVLATVEHETAGTWRPVKESFWNSEPWRKANLRYYPFYGRGYVQLTWKSNYQKYSELTGYDLVNQPNKAMIPNVALFILVHGFRHGTFTGKRLDEFINPKSEDLYNARRVINWLDKTETITAITRRWENKIQGGVLSQKLA